MRVTGFILMAAIAAAFVRVLDELPLQLAELGALLAVAWFVGQVLPEVLRAWRDWRRPATPPEIYSDDYAECGDKMVIQGGLTPLYTRCQLRKNHDGDHEGSLSSATWSRTST